MAIQLGPFLDGIPPTTGSRFFVDSGASRTSDGNRGQDPNVPLATIDGAINRCTANNGDQIIVMPGHTESLLTDGQIAMDTAGVAVFGLGVGSTRPNLVYDATGTTGQISFSASNLRWSNIVHTASIAATANAINIGGSISNIEIDHCHFTFDATGIEFTVMLDIGDGTYADVININIHHNWFQAENIDGCGSALLIDDCQYVIFQNNLVTGDYNSVAIDGAAGSSSCKDYVITDNVIESRDTGLTIDLDDAATGIIANNSVTGGGAIAGIVDWGNCLNVQNFVCDALDTTGIVIPPTASA
jgi:hypothetical protein